MYTAEKNKDRKESTVTVGGNLWWKELAKWASGMLDLDRVLPPWRIFCASIGILVLLTVLYVCLVMTYGDRVSA